MDGNHSVKCLEGSGSADKRVFNSRYFISEAAVELFEDDVCNWPGEQPSGENANCTENWTATKSVKENKIFVFEQTGIFILACRHGFVESIVEMKRSGELTKYGLAATSCLLNVCGDEQAVGYIIGCSSCKTITASSIGARAKSLNLIVAVNITEGRFLFNNYIQALKIIEDYMPLLEEFKSQKSLTDQDFIQWHQEEIEFLGKLAVEPPYDVLAVAYVEELEKLHVTEFVIDGPRMNLSLYGSITSVPFLMYTPASFMQTSWLNASTWRQSRTVKAEHLLALRKYELQMNIVDDFEWRNGINEHWTTAHPGYTQALEYGRKHHFIQTVKQLEGLVIQHLFEFSKANLANTGYKIWKHISKAIIYQSAAICSMLEKYNKLAPLQTPPRPILDYSEVVGYATLSEFSLLKHSRHDLLSKPWAVPDNWEMVARYFKVVRSHKEIAHLNVEICCLDAWIEYDDAKMLEVIEMLTVDETDSLLAAELRRQYNEWHHINNVHHHRLDKIHYLKGYSGLAAALWHNSVEMERSDNKEEPVDVWEDDELNDEASHLEDAISHL
ncbi:hypothetical protein F4604DRAFT_1878662 [Suillus subluteus]|nr:hypothetical protein F4604DRAFT_1878662 [Suillus subluteus]